MSTNNRSHSGPSSDRYHALFTSAVDAIIVIRHDGIVDTVNPAAEQLFGYSTEEFIGRNVNFLMPDEHRKRHDDYLRNYIVTGEKKIIGIGREVSGKRKDGTIFPMHLSVGEFEEHGELLFTGIIHDLSVRRKAENALRQAQKMDAIGQLTGGFAHDFNNLLTIVIGNLDLLEMQKSQVPNADLVREAQEAADAGARLIERLLAFARRVPLEPIVLDLNALVDSLTDMLKRALGATIELDTTLNPEPWNVSVDPAQFESALVNLVINARDAMPSGGRLIIETKNVLLDQEYAAAELGLSPGDYVRLSVTDSGLGMPAKVLERVFEPFFTTKTGASGTGLGLAMVYGFTKQVDGHIMVYSEVEKGTTVNLYFPRATAEISDMQASKSSSPIKLAKGEAVLVVEDNEQIRRVTKARLEALGYHVILASNGEEAIEMLEENDHVDLVFTDIVMPGRMSGYEIVEHVEENHETIKILLTSGYADDLMKSTELAAKGVQLLRKPYHQAELADTLRNVLDD